MFLHYHGLTNFRGTILTSAKPNIFVPDISLNNGDFIKTFICYQPFWGFLLLWQIDCRHRWFCIAAALVLSLNFLRYRWKQFHRKYTSGVCTFTGMRWMIIETPEKDMNTERRKRLQVRHGMVSNSVKYLSFYIPDPNMAVQLYLKKKLMKK